MSDMGLLILYAAVALGTSFVCSLCEAALLSLPASHAVVLKEQGRWAGALLEKMKRQIDRPLAAILTLNTIANTIGAAGVGAQALQVWGDKWLAVASAVLTLLILVFSEIIPKTIGAVYARSLVDPVVYIVRAMMILTAPIVVLLDFISRIIRAGGNTSEVQREHIAVLAELGRVEGVLHGSESRIIRNLLRLTDVRVSEVMTPRTVALMFRQETTVHDVLAENAELPFSRIPVYVDDPDHVTGVALRHDIFDAARRGQSETPLSEITRPIHAVPETATLLRTLESFLARGDHIFLVVDEYGGTAGLITLEDVLESVVGAEIVDETDPRPDMRRLAR